MNDLTIAAPPRIAEATFLWALQAAGSPARPAGLELYAIIASAGLDPAVALAFFGHESSFGTRGLCADYNLCNWGNVRSPHVASRAEIVTPPGRGPFARFATWQDGLLDWCERINEAYIQRRGLTTVRAITPVYAPSSDGNRPAAYADAVLGMVATWQAQERPASSLERLNLLDVRPRLSVVPSKARTQRERPIASLTLHYNGPALGAAGNAEAELRHIIEVDVPWQQKPPLSADSLQYHFCVLSSGQIVLTRDLDLIAWHCGSKEGNETSLAIHLPIGGTQEPTAAQWAATELLCETLIATYSLGGPASVRAHNEWKATLCPGPAITRRLKAYRGDTVVEGGLFRIIASVAGANVREGPGTRYPVALQGRAVMWPGDVLDADVLVMGEPVGGDPRWAHRRDGLGFVHRSLLEAV